MPWRQIGVGDRAPDGVAVAAGGDAPGHLAVHAHGLVAERHRARGSSSTRQASVSRGLRSFASTRASRPTKPSSSSSLHAEAEAAFVGGLVGRDVGTPHAIPLLQAQPSRSRGSRRRPGRGARRPPTMTAIASDRTPWGSKARSRAPHVGHPQRPHGHVAHGGLPQRHIGEVVVVETLGRERPEHVAGPRAPDPSTPTGRSRPAPARAVVRQVSADPLAIVVTGKAVPVTIEKRSSPRRATVKSHSIPPRELSIWV